MTCIHGSTIGLCRRCEHDGPNVAPKAIEVLYQACQDLIRELDLAQPPPGTPEANLLLNLRTVIKAYERGGP